MKVAVIGAGTAGLCSAHRLLEQGLSCVVFERGSELGGTWIYTDDTGLDEYGLPIHTSMYKSLRTNLPKEAMGFPDFPIPAQKASYIPARDILNFLNLYADHFKLREHIKFNHYVELIKPTKDDKWEIKAKDLTTKKTVIEIFDAVMVCNGHYHAPFIPQIHNKDIFKGPQIHSHDYRKPDPYTNARVLVLGAGPSGMDIALEVASVAKHVTLSHRMKRVPRTVFPKNMTMVVKEVTEILEDGAKFEDGSIEKFDIILYCTGYLYSFPFLSPECGITVSENYVQPLYKHLVNIERPTMALIGIPFYVCAAQMFDLQIRFVVEYLCGKFQLPSKEEMRADTERDMQKRWARGDSKRKAHIMGPDQEAYYNDLATTAGITPISPVMTKMHNDSSERFLDELDKFRDDVYKIVDEENFECEYKYI